MRRLTLLAVLVLGLAACGGSGGSNAVAVTFGTKGGSIRSYTISIAPGGAVTTTGGAPAAATSLTSAQDLILSSEVRDAFGKLASTQCPGTFPDEAAEFITALGKTVTVRGQCEAAFTQLWGELTLAVEAPPPVGG